MQFKTGELVEVGDLKLIGGAGGSAFLRFATPGGSAPGTGGKLGDFSNAERTDSVSYGSDTRNEFANEFFVYTSDGGIAHVHIVQRGWPRLTVEYVWRPKADGQ